jgi:hypothetical protein
MNDETFLVLNAVYLRKIATAEVVRECTGLGADAIRAALDGAVADLLVEDLGGQFMLNDEGTQAVRAGYAERYAPLRAEPDVEAWYQRFESLNSQFLTTISAWQTGGDEGQLDRLLKLVERQIRALGTIAATVPRYAGYADRFSRALSLVEEGKTEFVTSPTLDSIHNVWFEFHEDILTLLGRPRDVAEGHAG